MEWTIQAACKGKTHLYFAPANERAKAREERIMQAVAICDGCPVQAECGSVAKAEEYGIWAGTALRP